VGLSRNYLLVHWPIDVLVGYIIGTLFAFIITPFSLKLYDDKQKFGLFCIITSIITGLFSLIIAPLMTFNIVDTLAFSSLADMCEIATGLYFGFFLEEKFIDFKECKNLKGTIINLLGCGALIGVIYFIASFIPDKYIRHLFRNTLLGFSASYLYPLLASKLGILKKNEKN
ncbi:MAG: phosphatase PAP2 family protein, partial [Spirochaetales bacterium]|nr:phosphatase PAP2 family protein [Spirochaetales bacterium]